MSRTTELVALVRRDAKHQTLGGILRVVRTLRDHLAAHPELDAVQYLTDYIDRIERMRDDR